MLKNIIEKINELLKTGGQVFVAIDGDAAAGKSTLGGELAAHFNCPLIQMDDFFLPPALRTPARMAEAGGNVDYERFKKEVLEPLLDGQPFSFRPFDCKVMDFVDEKSYKPSSLTIIEGAYSLHPSLNEAYSFKIFMQIDKEEQKKRILTRNGEEMLEKFLNIWIPMEKRYHEAFNVRQMCDVVI